MPTEMEQMFSVEREVLSSETWRIGEALACVPDMPLSQSADAVPLCAFAREFFLAQRHGGTKRRDA